MKPEFAVVFAWFCLIGCPLLALLNTWECRRLAYKMGERYTAPMAVMDNLVFLLMLMSLSGTLERAHFFPKRSLESLIIPGIAALILLYGLIFGPKLITYQRYTKWKIAQEGAVGVTEFKDNARRRLTWTPWLVVGIGFAVSGIFLWIRGITTSSLIAVAIMLTICIVFAPLMAYAHRRNLS